MMFFDILPIKIVNIDVMYDKFRQKCNEKGICGCLVTGY